MNDIELAEERVANRVRLGGHNIPGEVIRRRYCFGLHNLFNIFIPIVDKWMIVDNSDLSQEIVAEGGVDKVTVIRDNIKYLKIKTYGRERAV